MAKPWKGALRWSFIPGAGPHLLEVTGSRGPHGVLVRWRTGPLRGREARIDPKGLKQNRAAADKPEHD